MIFNVRELDADTQSILAATPTQQHALLNAKPYQFPLHMEESMTEGANILTPAAARFAPIVARYRTFLEPEDTLVFRNGFNMFDPTEAPKRIVTHIFHSVSAEGELENDFTNPEVGRNIDVSFIAPLAKKSIRRKAPPSFIWA